MNTYDVPHHLEQGDIDQEGFTSSSSEPLHNSTSHDSEPTGYRPKRADILRRFYPNIMQYAIVLTLLSGFFVGSRIGARAEGGQRDSDTITVDLPPEREMNNGTDDNIIDIAYLVEPEAMAEMGGIDILNPAIATGDSLFNQRSDFHDYEEKFETIAIEPTLTVEQNTSNTQLVAEYIVLHRPDILQVLDEIGADLAVIVISDRTDDNSQYMFPVEVTVFDGGKDGRTSFIFITADALKRNGVTNILNHAVGHSAGDEHRRAFINTDENYGTSMATGQVPRLMVDSTPDKLFEGKIIGDEEHNSEAVVRPNLNLMPDNREGRREAIRPTNVDIKYPIGEMITVEGIVVNPASTLFHKTTDGTLVPVEIEPSGHFSITYFNDGQNPLRVLHNDKISTLYNPLNNTYKQYMPATFSGAQFNNN